MTSYETWESKKLSILVCLDLSAAFDKVDHKVLLQTLHKCFRIDDDALQWYESFLSGREVKGCISDTYSKPRKIYYFAPQGSIQGPVLFNCSSSTLKFCVPDSIGMSGFAHDHTLLSTFDLNSETDQLVYHESGTLCIRYQQMDEKDSLENESY